jgi:TDG/mug DNA glycosylase family protein
MKRVRASHGFPPLYDAGSAILILGSFPSVRSREERFFYAHPQNRFWRVVAEAYEEKTPGSIEEKKALILKHRLALYDVIESCSVSGSSDASILDVTPADLREIKAPIRKILLNGKKAAALFERYAEAPAGVQVVALPSTSPANAAYSLADLLQEWRPALLDK